MTCVAASLSPTDRQHLAVKMLAQTEPVAQIARDNEVSRPFLYRQKALAAEGLAAAFDPPGSEDSSVLFHLPVTHTWLQ